MTDINIRSFTINSEGQLFAGTLGGVFQSTDNGESWTEFNTGLTNLNILSLAVNSNGHIFAGTYGSGVFYWFTNKDGKAVAVHRLMYEELLGRESRGIFHDQ